MKQLMQKIQNLFKSNTREQKPRTNPFAHKLTDPEFEAIINYVRAMLIAEQNAIVSSSKGRYGEPPPRIDGVNGLE